MSVHVKPSKMTWSFIHSTLSFVPARLSNCEYQFTVFENCATVRQTVTERDTFEWGVGRGVYFDPEKENGRQKKELFQFNDALITFYLQLYSV